MDKLNSTYDFFLQVITTSLYQFLSMFGFIFIFGLLLYFLSRSTRKAFRNSSHDKLDIYFTGWIGTPVHELGHAVFCILFGHRITDIKLYGPNSQDGTLGYVNHSFNSKSLYQRIGGLFIGAGPILFGSFVLYLLIWFCLPNYIPISEIISKTELSGSGVFDLLKNTGMMMGIGLNLLVTVFSPENFGKPLFWLFIYLSFCISSHMQLSPPDLKSMVSGIFTILLVFLLVNSLTMLLELNVTNYILKFNRLTGSLINIFILATMISFINFLMTYLILAVVHYKKHKSLLSIW
jgi:hypothetical protein